MMGWMTTLMVQQLSRLKLSGGRQSSTAGAGCRTSSGTLFYQTGLLPTLVIFDSQRKLTTLKDVQFSSGGHNCS
jgi:hypothetical protein